MKALSLVIFLLTMGSAWAQNCAHRITLTNATIQIQNGTQVVAQSYTVRQTGSNSDDCNRYRLYFSTGIANSYQREAQNTSGARVDYNLHNNLFMLGTLKDINDANSFFEYVQGNTPNRDVDYTGVFYISVPGLSSQGNIGGGTYTDNILIRIYAVHQNGSLGQLGEVKPFSVNILSNTTMAISIVDEGGAHDANSTVKVLNFGNLMTNAEMGADITVTSNTAYQVRLSSLNNGNLKRTTSSLPYQLRVNGTSFSLNSSATSPVTVATGVANGTTPTRYNVKVKITGDTTTLPAGDYEDTITITLMAN